MLHGHTSPPKEHCRPILIFFVPHRDTQISLAVTNMICVSLTEDQYGVAQAQIPRVMECLIECLETVKTFSMKICEEYGSGKSSGDENRTRETPVRRSDEDLREALDEFVSPLLTREFLERKKTNIVPLS